MTTPPASPAPRKRTRWFVRIARLLLIAIATWWIGLYFLQDSIIYPGTRLSRTTKETYTLRPGEIETKVGAQQDVTLFLLPPEGWKPEAKLTAPLVVYFHGNYELAQYALRSTDTTHLRQMGFWVAIPEYRGYDAVPGKPRQDQITADMVDAITWLKAQPGIDPKRISFLGRSLGGGVAIATAQRTIDQGIPFAIVTRSTFRSVSSLASGFLAPRWLVRSPWDNEAILPTLDVPILLAHGKRDEIIPFAHAEALARIAKRPTTYFVEGSHDHYDDKDAFLTRMTTFFQLGK